MTEDQLHDAINANPTAKALADAGRDVDAAAAIAAALPAVLRETRHTYLSLAGVIDPAIVRRLITTLAAVAQADLLVDVAHARLRSDNGVDVGHPTVRGMLDQFAANQQLPTTPQDAAAIKLLAETPQTVTADAVSAAWLRHRPDGKIPHA